MQKINNLKKIWQTRFFQKKLNNSKTVDFVAKSHSLKTVENAKSISLTGDNIFNTQSERF